MKTDDGNFTALLVYLDDIFIGSASVQESNKVKDFLNSLFKLRDLGTVKYFLGLEIAKSPEGISICQRKYTLDLLEKNGLLGAKLVSTPIDYNHKLCKVKDGEILSDPTSYRQLIGKLIYLTFSRPDICYDVQVLSQFMDKPGKKHLVAAHRILKYLKASSGQGILMKSKSTLKISRYADSDWAGCSDTRRSVIGFCIFIRDSLVSWKSKKQSVVAKSSVEAEYRSMVSTCCEMIWIKSILEDSGIKQNEAIDLYSDS